MERKKQARKIKRLKQNGFIIKKYQIIIDKPVRLTIAVIADTHGMFPDSLISTMIFQKPDIICIVGDLVDKEHPFTDAAIRFLNQCVRIATTYMSLGNNDCVLSYIDIENIKKTGTIILDNCWKQHSELVAVGGLTSAMVLRTRKYGIESKHKTQTEVSWLNKFGKLDCFKILLDHHPENYEIYTKDKPIDLIISGHTHGGQVSIFGYGLFVPGQKIWPRYSGGYYCNKLVVSRGLSNTLPFPRVFNPPELVILECFPSKCLL